MLQRSSTIQIKDSDIDRKGIDDHNVGHLQESLFLTVILAIDGTSHREGFQHRQNPRSACRPPVVREAQIVVRSKVEHALGAIGQSEGSKHSKGASQQTQCRKGDENCPVIS